MPKDREPTYQDLIRIDKHPNFYINPKSGKIVFRRTHKGETVTIRTGVVGKIDAKKGVVIGIAKAKEVVEIELEKRRSGGPTEAARRKIVGITNPYIDDIWFELIREKAVGKEPSTCKNYWKSWKYGMRGFWGRPPRNNDELKEDLEKCPQTIPQAPFKTCRDLMNPEVIAAYKAWYLETWPTRYFNQTFIHFNMLCRYAVQRKYIPNLPDLSALKEIPEIIQKRSKRKAPGRVYTNAQVEALLKVHEKFKEKRINGITEAHRKMIVARVKLGIRLGLRGLRKMEALKLLREKVNLKKRVMEVWSEKNHKWREVPLTDDLIEAFKEQFAVNPESKWVFPMPSDPTRHISAQVFDKVWYEARNLAGIVPTGPLDCRFHDLRHTFATWTAEMGWPPRIACDVLDMSLETYEKVYAKPRGQSKAEWMEKTFRGMK